MRSVIDDAALGDPAGPVRIVETGSGAVLAYFREVVVKLHHPRTRELDLRARLRLAADPMLAEWLLAPLSPEPLREPTAGRLATLWPRVQVLAAEDEPLPWREAGELLAGLHRAAVTTAVPHAEAFPHAEVAEATEVAVLPRTIPAARITRALARVDDAPEGPLLRRVGRVILHELAVRPSGSEALSHGDWHLGQLARARDGWRLIDLDDLGIGDPAWDLARPAGFWAAGLLDHSSWFALLTSYQDAGGPAVSVADPWRTLDLPARAAVLVAACREVGRARAVDGDSPLPALLEACAQM